LSCDEPGLHGELGESVQPLTSDAAAVVDIKAAGASSNCCNQMTDQTCLAATRTIIDNALSTASIHFPPGEYCWSGLPIFPPSNRTISGSGTQSILRRVNQAGFFKIAFTDHLTIRDLAFDYNAAPAFFAAISIHGPEGNDPSTCGTRYDCNDPISRTVRIEGNHFSDTVAYTSGGDRWAISLGNVDGIWIERNRVEPSRDGKGNPIVPVMQLTANGGDGVRNAFITDNYVESPRANGIAISTVHSTATFQNIHIARNVIRNASGIAVFVGPDYSIGDNGVGTIQNIMIADNVISWDRALGANAGPAGVYVRAFAGTNSRNIRVVNNSVSTDVPIGDPNRHMSSGVRFETDLGAPGTRFFEDVAVHGNTLRGGRYGVRATYVKGVSVAGNVIRQGDAITIDHYDDAVISGNQLLDNTTGIKLGPGANATVDSNVVRRINAGQYFAAAFMADGTGLGAAPFDKVRALLRDNRFVDGASTVAFAQILMTDQLALDYINNDFRNNPGGVCHSAGNGCTPTGISQGNVQ
jgi:hypothetical protein